MMKRKANESERDYVERKLRKLQKKLQKIPSEPEESTTSTSPESSKTPPPIEQDNAEDLVLENDVLPEEFPLALGTEGEENEVKGPEIRNELATRWKRLMSTGLGKENQELIMKKYPAPANFGTEAPKINPEISASLSEISIKRDKRIIHRQNLTLKVMCALGHTLTNVLKGNINSSSIIEHVNDAAKLCCEIFYEDSSSRKFFALSGANQTIKEAVREAKPDEFLFGQDCGEKIKAAQAIKKTSSQIKVPEASNNKLPVSTKQVQPKRQGNWRGPPQQQQHQRTRGGHRQAPGPETESTPGPSHLPPLNQTSPPTSPSAYPGCRAAVSEAYMRRGTPTSALQIMLNSLSQNTMRQYNSTLKLWWQFCKQHSLDPYQVSIPYILNFLSQCFEMGASYGTLNSTRSALSLIMGPNIGNDDRIKRLMKGIYRSNPPKPKYNVTWDPGVVLNYLATLPMSDVPLELLTKKLVTLLALATGHRVQTLSLICLKNIVFSNDKISIFIPDIIKTSKKGTPQPLLQLPIYQSKLEICPVHTLKSYIEATKPLRTNHERLILTFKRPYIPASTQSISRWIKKTLNEAGIDVSIFTAHSTRHSSTSAALRSGLSIDQIQQTAGWSQNSATFARHYNRPVTQSLNFTQAVLDTSNI